MTNVWSFNMTFIWVIEVVGLTKFDDNYSHRRALKKIEGFLSFLMEKKLKISMKIEKSCLIAITIVIFTIKVTILMAIKQDFSIFMLKFQFFSSNIFHQKCIYNRNPSFFFLMHFCGNNWVEYVLLIVHKEF